MIQTNLKIHIWITFKQLLKFRFESYSNNFKNLDLNHIQTNLKNSDLIENLIMWLKILIKHFN